MAIDGVTSCMKIREVNKNKKQFISLLLLADEQESMVDRYLEKGTMYVLEDNDVKAECVVTDEGNGILEIKNIAVDPENQGKGYGKALIDFLASKYADEYSVLQVGTGDSPLVELRKSEFVERFLELSLFYGLSSPLNSEMIYFFPLFLPLCGISKEIRNFFI